MIKARSKLNQTILIFLLVSFLGWGLETVFCSALNGGFCDRGFLTLPFCTIYGFSILAIDKLIGTPKGGGLLLRRCRHRIFRPILYFLLAVLIPSIAELVTGAFFDRLFGIRLWDYSSYRFHLWGYVCVAFSLLWGILITVFMAWPYPWMRRLVEKIPRALASGMAVILIIAVCTDWILCFASI